MRWTISPKLWLTLIGLSVLWLSLLAFPFDLVAQSPPANPGDVDSTRSLGAAALPAAPTNGLSFTATRASPSISLAGAWSPWMPTFQACHPFGQQPRGLGQGQVEPRSSAAGESPRAGGMDEMRLALLAALVEEGTITQEEAGAFEDVHERLIVAGLMGEGKPLELTNGRVLVTAPGDEGRTETPGNKRPMPATRSSCCPEASTGTLKTRRGSPPGGWKPAPDLAQLPS